MNIKLPASKVKVVKDKLACRKDALAIITKLFKYFVYLSKKERVVEMMRQLLCSNRAFEPTHVFTKIADNSELVLKADKILEFVTKFSSVDEVSIEKCHLLVRNWESKFGVGYLTLTDFN